MVLIHIELAPYHLSQLLFCQSNRRRPVHCVQRSSVATAWLWRTGQRTVSSLGSLARGGQLRQRTFRHGVCYTLYQTNKKGLSVTGKTNWPALCSVQSEALKTLNWCSAVQRGSRLCQQRKEWSWEWAGQSEEPLPPQHVCRGGRGFDAGVI